ncbi:MAG: formylglycine-generating enzyme family protein, partial [Planctomycetota bacterium]
TATVGTTFFLSAYELTQAQWAALVAASGSAVSPAPWNEVVPAQQFGLVVDDAAPAYGVSEDQCASLAASWNAADGGGYSLRLPSSTEWEYACRGGGTSSSGLFNWVPAGAPIDAALDVATAAEHAVVIETLTDDVIGVRVVGERQANALGLYDMHGNVWEWVSNGGSGGAPVLRGGSWADDLLHAASGNRLPVDQGVPYATAGVRLVLVAP